MFLFPFEDVHTRNHESFPINFRSSPVTVDDTSHLAATLVQEVPADSGNFPWYMTDSIAVLEESYSEVVVNVIDWPRIELAPLLRCRKTTKLCKRDVHEQCSRSVSVCISCFV